MVRPRPLPAPRHSWARKPAARASALVLATVSLGARAGVARAADCDSAAAKRLFTEGMKHLDAQQWDQACPRFEQSLACHPRASTQTKVAICREHEGKLADALVAYERALILEADPKKAHEVAAEIRGFIDAIEPRVPRMTITVSPAPANLEVRLNDHPVALSALTSALRLNPGAQRVVANAPGYREQQVTVTLEEGASRNLAIVLMETAPEPGPEPSASAPPSPVPVLATTSLDARPTPALRVTSVAEVTPRPRSSAWRTVGLLTGAGGLITLAAAGYFALRTTLLVREADARCYPDGTCDQPELDLLHRAGQMQNTGFVLGGVGAIVTVVGAVLVLTDSRGRPADRTAENQPQPHAVRGVALSATMSPCGVSAQARW